MTIGTVTQLTQKDRARLRKLITEYSGLGEAIQGDEVLDQAVARRLVAHRLGSLAEYWPLIRPGPGGRIEMNSLVQLLTNKETFLFREMHHFEVLRERVLPELLAGRSQAPPPLRGRPLRIWSAGCSTGEEPYSLAIALLEYQARHGSFAVEVIGTDIDASALQTAQRGCYGERSLRLVTDDLRRQYFASDGQNHCIVPKVARLVTFKVHNLAEDCCPPDLVELDIIFCRNVTIYFDDEARDRLNARLTASLRPGGYLFVASAETMGHNRGRLELVSLDKTFLFRKSTPTAGAEGGEERTASRRLQAVIHSQGPTGHLPKTQYDQLPSFPRLPGRDTSRAVPAAAPDAAFGPSVPARRGADTSSIGLAIRRAFSAFEQQDYGMALRELDRIHADQVLRPEASCLRAAILLQQERLDEAEDLCQLVLAHDPWHADAHFLLGLVSRQRGQAADALQSLRQAVYLQPSHRDAHYFLAEIYRTLEMRDNARREYENTLNIMGHRPQEPPVLNLTGLTDDMVRGACQLNLRNLREKRA